MIRFWFQFAVPNSPFQLGCGVTAVNYDDAIFLLKQKAFKGQKLPEIINHIENIEASLLDQNHVLPNMGVTSVRGIWFPLGYE